jgi:cytochrome c oxidase subunit 2
VTTPTPDALHDALQAFGPQAGQVVDLWRVFLWICTLVFIAILAALVHAARRAPRSDEITPPDLGSVNQPEVRTRRHVATAVIVSGILLFVLLAASVFTDRAIARMPLANAVHVQVTAHQWWWTVRYIDGEVIDQFETANEIHVPVGRPVIIQLFADDVIHSLWVPSLAGKRDLIPGRPTLIQFRADQPGTYRGQCAEFCGYQHALMGFLVIAQPQAEYDAWVAAERKSAPPPPDAKLQHGQMLFTSTACAMCHTVQGTLANGKHAPDLTHVGSRRTLAAGTLANTPENLKRWISNPQQIKPGANMPAIPMSNDDLDAIVSYVGSLK